MLKYHHSHIIEIQVRGFKKKNTGLNTDTGTVSVLGSTDTSTRVAHSWKNQRDAFFFLRVCSFGHKSFRLVDNEKKLTKKRGERKCVWKREVDPHL